MLSGFRHLSLGRPSLRHLALAATLVAAWPLSGCGSNEKGAATTSPSAAPSASASTASTSTASTSVAAPQVVYPQVFKDELNHEVTLNAAPARVFAPGLEDSLLSLGVTPVAQWANGSNVQDYLQQWLSGVPAADFANGLPSSETVLSFKPDLIVLSNSYYADNGVYEQYAKIAPTFAFNNAATDLTGALQQIGTLLGKQEQADAALAEYEQKVAAAKTELGSLIQGKKAAVIRFNAKGMFLMGGNYYGGYVLAHDLGFGKAKLVETEDSVDMSLELLPDLDADYIFLVNDSHSGDAFVKQLTDSALWKGMPQVKAGRTYEVTDESWLSGGLIASASVIDQVVRLMAP